MKTYPQQMQDSHYMGCGMNHPFQNSADLYINWVITNNIQTIHLFSEGINANKHSLLCKITRYILPISSRINVEYISKSEYIL